MKLRTFSLSGTAGRHLPWVISVFSFLILFSAHASAQYNPEYEKLRFKRGSLATMEGERLTKEETIAVLSDVNGISMYEDWNKAGKLYNTGKWLLIGSGALVLTGGVIYSVSFIYFMAEVMAGGLATAFTLGQYQFEGVSPVTSTMIQVGAYSFLAGTAGLVAGTAVFCTGKGRMKRIVSSYNKANTPQVSIGFGAQKYGIGLAVNF